MYTVLLFKFGPHLCKGSMKLRQQSIKMSASEDEVVAFNIVRVRHFGENTGVSSTPLSLKMLQYDHFSNIDIDIHMFIIFRHHY